MSPQATTKAFVIFAMHIRARRILAGQADGHVEVAA